MQKSGLFSVEKKKLINLQVCTLLLLKNFNIITNMIIITSEIFFRKITDVNFTI